MDVFFHKIIAGNDVSKYAKRWDEPELIKRFGKIISETGFFFWGHNYNLAKLENDHANYLKRKLEDQEFGCKVKNYEIFFASDSNIAQITLEGRLIKDVKDCLDQVDGMPSFVARAKHAEEKSNYVGNELTEPVGFYPSGKKFWQWKTPVKYQVKFEIPTVGLFGNADVSSLYLNNREKFLKALLEDNYTIHGVSVSDSRKEELCCFERLGLEVKGRMFDLKYPHAACTPPTNDNKTHYYLETPGNSYNKFLKLKD